MCSDAVRTDLSTMSVQREGGEILEGNTMAVNCLNIQVEYCLLLHVPPTRETTMSSPWHLALVMEPRSPIRRPSGFWTRAPCLIWSRLASITLSRRRA
jgi:hypothetical protein